MIKKSLQNAVIEIKQAVKESANAAYPYFFIVGAGISSPSVPLANELISECEKKAAKDYGVSGAQLDAPNPKATSMEKYSHWMKKAYPHAKSRQNYIKSLINKQPVSLANQRLAHILGSNGKLARLVVTPNFDDHLSRSLHLFGLDFVICDHPSTTARVSLERDEPITILHVHGTYWFYDCCNLDDEICGHAEQAAEYRSMGHLLDSILAESSPMVIGYSGWEKDVIMQALKRRLSQPDSKLPYNLYWFCYTSTDVESLPTWLKDHQSVTIVAPPGKPAVDTSTMSDDGTKAIKTELSEKAQDAQVIRSQNVFEEIISQFSINPPLLITDPLNALIASLKSFTDSTQEQQNNIYSFKNVTEVVVRASQLLADEKRKNPAPRHLDDVRRSIEEAKYVDALTKLKQLSEIDPNLLNAKIDEVLNWVDLSLKGLPATAKAIEPCDSAIAVIDRLSPEQSSQEQKVQALILCISALQLKATILDSTGQHQDELYQYEELIRRLGDAPESSLRERAARTLVNKGITLGQMHKPQDEVATYEEVVRRFGNAPEPAVCEQVARALVCKGVTLGQLQKPQDAVAAFEEVVRRFRDAPETALRIQVGMALVNKGIALGQMHKPQDSVATYEELVLRFGDAPEPALRGHVAVALVNKGVTLGQMHKPGDAVAAFEEAARRFGDDPEPALREQVASALVNKGVALGRMHKPQDAVATFEEMVLRFGDAPEPALRGHVARALVNKGITLGQMHKSQDEVATYEEVVLRFGDKHEPALREQVAMALFNKGVTLGQMHKPQDAVAALEEVVRRFGDAPDPALREQVARALVSKGVVLVRMHKPQDAVATYEEVVHRFGDDPYPALREQVASALWDRGIIFCGLGNPLETTKSLQQSLTRARQLPPALKAQFMHSAARDKSVLEAHSAHDPDSEYAELRQIVSECLRFLEDGRGQDTLASVANPEI